MRPSDRLAIVLCSAALIAATASPAHAAPRLALNGGASRTTRSSVSVTSRRPGATRMSFKVGRSWSRWRSFRRTATLRLPQGDGRKLVRARYRTNSGSITYASAAIVVDTHAPVGTLAVASQTLGLPSLVRVVYSARGAALMRFATNGYSSGWIAYAAGGHSFIFTSLGAHRITAQFKDLAGNVSSNTVTVGVPASPIHVSGRVSSNATWAAGVYSLESDVIVDAGVRLKLQPGARLVAARPDCGLSVYGALDASATADGRISLGPAPEAVGAPWGIGIAFCDGSSGSLRGVEVTGQATAVAVGASNVVISGCTFADNNRGVEVSADAKAMMSSNAFLRNTEYGVCFDTISAASGLDANSTYSGNGAGNTIPLRACVVTSDTTLPAAPVVFRVVGGISVEGAKLTIGPGANLTFSGDALSVGGPLGPGQLVVAGTASRPCTLTSYPVSGVVQAPGDWDGVCINPGSTAAIAHASITYANAAVTLANDGGAPASISDCVLARNIYGVRSSLAPSRSTAPVITRNTITDNVQYGLWFTEIAAYGKTENTQTYQRNGHGNCIAFAHSDACMGDVTLFDPTGGGGKIAYVMLSHTNGVGANSTLTIGPGAVLKVEHDLAGGGAGGGGALVSAGTTSSPVLITSLYDDSIGGHNADEYQTPGPGTWGWVGADPGGTAIFRHTTVRFALYGIRLANDGGRPAEISDCTLVRNVYGVYSAMKPDPATAPLITRNTITDNTKYGIYLEQMVAYGRTKNTQTYLRNGHANCIAFSSANPCNGSVELFDPIGPSKIAYVLLYAYHTVSEGATLTVGPGAVIKCTNELTVNGSLQCSGTATEPILFTSYYDSSVGGNNAESTRVPRAGEWFDIVIGGDSNVVRYTTVHYASFGVSGGVSTVETLTVLAPGAVGMFLTGGVAVAEHVTIPDARVVVIRSTDATLTLRHSLVHHSSTGIEVRDQVSRSDVRIEDCQITDLTTGVKSSAGDRTNLLSGITLQDSLIATVSTAISAGNADTVVESSQIASVTTGIVTLSGSLEVTASQVTASETAVRSGSTATRLNQSSIVSTQSGAAIGAVGGSFDMTRTLVKAVDTCVSADGSLLDAGEFRATECTFTGASVGVEMATAATGIEISDCVFEELTKGFVTDDYCVLQGAPRTPPSFSDCSFSDSTITSYFVEGPVVESCVNDVCHVETPLPPIDVANSGSPRYWGWVFWH